MPKQTVERSARNTDKTEMYASLAECKTNFSRFAAQASINARRIKAKFPDLNTERLFFLCFERDISPTVRDHLDNILITDEPSEIFGIDPVYHVTSSAVLKDLASGKEIIPPEFHRYKKTRTHRGIGLELWSRLCNALEIDTAKKDMFIWTGRKVDPEQLIIEDHLARTGHGLDTAIINLIFEQKGEKYQGNEPFFKIRKELQDVLQCLDSGNKPEDNFQLNQFVEKFCRDAFFLFGIRDGWYLQLKNKMLGRTKFKSSREIKDFTDIILTTALDFFAQQHAGKEEAVILKIDPRTIYSRHNLYPFPMTKRHPHTIIPLPSVSKNDITEVYVTDPETFDISLVPQGALLKSFSDIPRENWLGGTYRGNLKIEDIDPENPLCQLNYPEPASKVYRMHFDKERIALALTKNYQYQFISHPKDEVDIFITTFGSEIFSHRDDLTDKDKRIIFHTCFFNKIIEGVVD